MFHPLSALALGFFGAAFCAAAIAQHTPAQRTDAQQTSGPPAAAASAYRSALEGYRPFADESVAPWQESNQAVREAGGWRAYARESRPAEAAAPARAASAAAPAYAPAPSAPAAGHQH